MYIVSTRISYPTIQVYEKEKLCGNRVCKLTWWLWLGDVPRLPDCTADGLLPLCVEGGRGGLAAQAPALSHHGRWLGCTRLALQQKFLKFIRSVADPESGAFLTLDPGSRMGKNQDPDAGSGMNNPDHISGSIESIFGVKILKFFYADP
jgi:hypothetical protein